MIGTTYRDGIYAVGWSSTIALFCDWCWTVEASTTLGGTRRVRIRVRICQGWIGGYGECLANGLGDCAVSIQTSTIDFVIATTAINDAGGCGVYNNQLPPGFTTITSPSFRSSTFSSIFEVDYSITTVPEATLTFHCYGTDAVAIVVDAISFDVGDSP